MLVAARSTSSAVVCSPGSVVVAQGTTCTATVTDTAVAGVASDPGGSVGFVSDSAGGFDFTSCVLDGGVNTADGISTCSVI